MQNRIENALRKIEIFPSHCLRLSRKDIMEWPNIYVAFTLILLNYNRILV